MKYYIIHPYPAESNRLLPDSAIISNIKTGRQLLSDIGHNMGYKWSYQAKRSTQPSIEVYTYSRNREAFYTLLNHYFFCIEEHERRRGIKNGKLHTFFLEIPHKEIVSHINPRDEYQAQAVYLMDHTEITEAEYLRLKEVMG